ncbi:hypothetical protein XENTR_v10009497 [Xenopus tropicalis]|nr:hypothetical protein XENTR_v10009497 [Xenopus tropicalis]
MYGAEPCITRGPSVRAVCASFPRPTEVTKPLPSPETPRSPHRHEEEAALSDRCWEGTTPPPCVSIVCARQPIGESLANGAPAPTAPRTAIGQRGEPERHSCSMHSAHFPLLIGRRLGAYSIGISSTLQGSIRAEPSLAQGQGRPSHGQWDEHMEHSLETSLVPCGKDKYISKNELLSHLKNYNLYYEGLNLQLRHREEEEELIVEGLLNIFWGLRRPIRLQMQDDNERIRPPPSSTSWHSGCNLLTQRPVAKPATIPDIQITEAEDNPTSTEEEEIKTTEDDTPQLMRTRSDVGVRRRGNQRTPGEQRRIKRHRFSINGHFYNHKTSVFTPAYGSVTNVRINSTMSTPQVLKLLLNKFKIENPASEFSLYMVHTSGEKRKLKDTDYPLIARILHGPCEQVSKVFLMEKDQVEEVTYDVAQYIKFEMPVLSSFIEKLKEEEDREVDKLMRRYTSLRVLIEQRLQDLARCHATM